MKQLSPIILRESSGNWADEYVRKCNAKEAKDLSTFKKQTIKDLEGVVKKIKAKGKTRLYETEVNYIVKQIIPYVQRTSHYPQSYRNVIAIIKEVLNV